MNPHRRFRQLGPGFASRFGAIRQAAAKPGAHWLVQDTTTRRYHLIPFGQRLPLPHPLIQVLCVC